MTSMVPKAVFNLDIGWREEAAVAALRQDLNLDLAQDNAPMLGHYSHSGTFQ